MFGLTKRQPTPTERLAGDSPERRRVVAPAVDIHETPAALVITADMPGVRQEDVQVVLDREVLSLRGTPPARASTAPTVSAERVPCVYERAFTIGVPVDATQVTANVRNGVLSVTLPKQAQARPRTIAVSAG